MKRLLNNLSTLKFIKMANLKSNDMSKSMFTSYDTIDLLDKSELDLGRNYLKNYLPNRKGASCTERIHKPSLPNPIIDTSINT